MKLSQILSSVALSCAMLFSTQASANEAIVVTGSTTVLPVMQKAAEAYMAANPDVKISISGGGSGSGIKALSDNLCNIAMASRDIKPNEIERAEKNGVYPKRTSVAIDALIPIINPKNPVSNLSAEQLQGIYMGTIKNWKEVGGNNAPIVVISRDTSSGTYETWHEKVMQKERVMPGALVQSSSGSIVQTVATNPNAIGYIGYGYLNDSLKPVNINDVVANQDSALDGSWAIARELYVFTNGDSTPEIQAFITYLLDPQKGQKAVAQIGYIPINNN